MNPSFFEKINYSACNEDSESERKALALTATDQVLCITGSGARPLDLLVDNPAGVLSVDFNASQNYLLELKIRAYQELTYTEFAAFLGLTHKQDRKPMYARLRPLLSERAGNYWDVQYPLIESGLLYCGTWESLLRAMSKASFFRKGLLHKLMHAGSLAEQAECWNQHWENKTWRLFLKLLCNRFLWTHLVREPGAALIPKTFDVASYMHERLHHLANTHLLGSNHFAHLLFYGEYRDGCLLPLHLREEHFGTLKTRVATISSVTDTLLNVLNDKTQTAKITAYSLSDFSSYAAENTYKAIWDALIGHAPVGARFCERQFLVKRSPDMLSRRILRNKALENELEETDLCAIYTFCAGTFGTGE